MEENQPQPKPEVSMAAFIEAVAGSGMKVISAIGWTSAVVLGVVAYQFWQDNKNDDFNKNTLLKLVETTSSLAGSCKEALGDAKNREDRLIEMQEESLEVVKNCTSIQVETRTALTILNQNLLKEIPHGSRP
jgi:hypothetical protein